MSKRILPTWLASGLLLGMASLATAQQQTQGYYPYGYYQGGQPQSNPWAPAAAPPAPQAEAAKPQEAAPAVAPAPPAAPPPVPKDMPAGIHAVNSRLGKVLADAQGRSLYVFDKETSGIPLCQGECARLWPPLLSDGNSPMATPFFLIPRDDGSRQWAWNGRPLYRWIGDSAEGDVTGDGMNGVWHALPAQ